MMKRLLRRYKTIFRWEWRHNRGPLVVWLLLGLSVLAIMIRSAMQGYWENFFIGLLVLVLFQVPGMISRGIGITFPHGLQIVILIHIYACEILGELGNYYIRYPHWDTIVHTVWGFLCAAIGYALVDILNRNDKTHFDLSPAFLAMVAFCFSMTIGVLWEFFEFSMDRLFQMDMQKDTVVTEFASVMLDPANSNTPILVSDITEVSINGENLELGGYLDIGLYDTIEDLFVNMIGALTFAIIGYKRSKSENAKKIAENFIPHLTDAYDRRSSA